MALLVLWFLVYFVIEVFRGVGASKTFSAPGPVGAALAVVADEDTPIAVDWELLPSVEQATDRN